MIQNKTILVTGAAGFIGMHLVKRLLHEGWKVVGLDSINDYYDVNLKYSRLAHTGVNKADIEYNVIVQSTYPDYQFVQLKLEDSENMTALFEHFTFGVVCNLAAQAGVRYSIENPMAYVQSNVVGFTNLLQLSQQFKIEHLVYASSSSVYGLNEKIPFSTHDPVNHPVSLYAATKKSNELMAHVYSHLCNLPTTGLRFFTVYGPWGRPDMSPMLFADAILNNKKLKVFNHGQMKRDFTYVDDIVEGVIRVINKPAVSSESWNGVSADPATSKVPYRIYNIGNSAPVNLMEYIETMESLLGKKADKEFLPMQAGDVLNTYSDVSDLENEFGYRPETKLQDGLANFVTWYKNYYNV